MEYLEGETLAAQVTAATPVTPVTQEGTLLDTVPYMSRRGRKQHRQLLEAGVIAGAQGDLRTFFPVTEALEEVPDGLPEPVLAEAEPLGLLDEVLRESERVARQGPARGTPRLQPPGDTPSHGRGLGEVQRDVEVGHRSSLSRVRRPSSAAGRPPCLRRRGGPRR